MTATPTAPDTRAWPDDPQSLVTTAARDNRTYDVLMDLSPFAAGILTGLRRMATDNSGHGTTCRLRLMQILARPTPDADAARLIQQLASDPLFQAALQNMPLTDELLQAYGHACWAAEPPALCPAADCGNFAATCTNH